MYTLYRILNITTKRAKCSGQFATILTNGYAAVVDKMRAASLRSLSVCAEHWDKVLNDYKLIYTDKYLLLYYIRSWFMIVPL